MTSSIQTQLAALRPKLLRFAQLQLRNPTQAEDVVQDTMIAVLEHPERFAGQSTLGTYVIGIMKHKIIDLLRVSKREVQISTLEDQSEEEAFDALFDNSGHWREAPNDWAEPHTQLERKAFFEVLEKCLEILPEKTARIFMMREWLELETEQICKELTISTSNAWVMLYRARMRLRECLDLNWFGKQVA